MIKELTCIECPVGCKLEINEEGGHVISLTGNKCEKGEAYGRQEIENPMRVLTSTVLSKNLDLKMVPVKTNKPIPKAKLMEAMDAVKKIKIDKPVKVGDVIVNNFLGFEVNLVATRETR